MKQRLIRPTAALFPMVGIAGALWANHSSVIEIFFFYYLIQIFSMCAADCFRNAATQEPSVRKVDRRFGGAFMPLIVGGCLTWLVWQHILISLWRSNLWKVAFVVAALISVEHLFEERMYMLGRRIDGVILSCLANGLLLAGLLLGQSGASNALDATYCAIIGAGIGTLVAIVASYSIEPIHDFSLEPVNYSAAASAIPQTLLYIAAVSVVVAIMKMRVFDMLVPILFGLIPWRLARTTCRRSQDESHSLNLILIAFAAIPRAAVIWFAIAQPYALMAYIALICATIVFCAPSERLYAGIALLAAAFITPTKIGAILALIAILLNLHKAFQKKV